MVFYGKITQLKRALALYLHKYHYSSCRDIAKACKISKSSAARIVKEKDIRSVKNATNCKSQGVRPRKLGERDVRTLVRSLKELRKKNVHITVKSLVENSGLSFEMASRRTFSRCLNENGYGYLQARKKGLLSEKDRKLRVQFSRKMLRIAADNPDFWMNEVAFFLDAVSFVHKYNPQSGVNLNRSRVWRKKGEGLQITAKGSKDLAGGRRLHVLVAIAHGKGVILAIPYEKMDGPFFAKFIREHFNMAFARAGPKKNGRRLFVMDNDPSQKSKSAKDALKDIEAEFLELPPRCGDIHCIENLFFKVKRYLEEQAVKGNICNESFEQFTARVIQALNNISSQDIDKLISSMNRRFHAVLASKGYKTTY